VVTKLFSIERWMVSQTPVILLNCLLSVSWLVHERSMAPTTYAMRKVLTICQNYAREYSISFNAFKSKCLVALPENSRNTLKKVDGCIFLYIDGRMIDLVQSFSHLGNLITSDLDDDEDITMRKYYIIGKVNNTLRYFGKLSSFVKYNLFHA